MANVEAARNVALRQHAKADRAGYKRLLKELNPAPLEVIAQMVGAPRSAVTQAASELRSAGIIGYRRGLITVTSMTRLHKRSCECVDAVSSAWTA